MTSPERDLPRYVYRGGSQTDRNLTPRTTDLDGFSVYATVEAAVRAERGAKAQKIELALLRKLAASWSEPPPAHLVLRPPTAAELRDWADRREESEPHPYTLELREAIVDVVRLGYEG